MELFITTGLLIFSTYATGYSPQNDSFPEVNNTLTREIPASFDDFFETSRPTFQETNETEVENQQPLSGIPGNHDDPVTSPTAKGLSEDTISSHFSKLTEKLHNNRQSHDGYEDSFGRGNPEYNQPPARRDVPSVWQQPEDVSVSSMPSNYYLYYPYDVRYLQNDYIDYPSAEAENADEKNGSSSRVVYEPGSRQEPQYYQKNYYYNYYPSLERRPVAGTKLRIDERGPLVDPNKRRRGTNTRKLNNHNSCRQYLEFLRYAFEKLDQRPDYDYAEEQWSDKLGQDNQHVFTTQMVGPTLYIDNSGNIAQLNSKENTIQSYDIYSGVPNAQRNPSADLRLSTPFKTPSLSSVHPSSQYPSGTSHSLPQTPSSTPGKVNFAYYESTTDKWAKSSVKIVSSTGTPFSSTTPKSVEVHYSSENLEEDNKYSSFYSKTTTAAPSTHWSSSESNYNTVGSYSERTKEHTATTGHLVNNASYGIGAAYNLIVPSTSQPPTQHTTEITNRFDDTKPPKKDVNCDDKMLPCPDTVNVTYPLNGYCNKYVTCESGRATRRTCPDGLHFNIITKSCDLPYNSFCTYVCPESNGYYGIPGDCGGYFVCRKSVPEYRMCPPHMHWNIEKSSCSFLEYSTCPMKCSSSNEVKPYEGDCKAYVICLSGIAYYHKCPPNTKFDKTSLTCVAENISKCEDDPRLLTKTVNPNVVCRDIELKVGAKTWCSFFEANKQRNYIP